jgi:hypothetical protein
MSVADERIIGGAPVATLDQVAAYFLGSDARRVDDAGVAELVNALWEYGARVGVRPDLAAAQIAHETARLAFGGDVTPDQHNPAGIGTTGGGVAGVTFADWRTGIAAYFVHLLTWCGRDDLAFLVAQSPQSLDPRVPLVQQVRATKGAATTWASLAGRWAVPGTGYAAGIERHYSAILAIPRGQPMNAPKIALASGHHNTSGGDAFEKQQTGPLCAAVAAHCRALGMDVRVVQPDDGLGNVSGSLDLVGNTVVKWADAGWEADIFLECHTEGGGGVGVFAIYPDAPGDVDTDVRDRLGPDAARRIGAATGLALGAGGDGVMSETQTGVGGQGSRLGIFRTTAPLAAGTTRLIIEYGAHDKEPDLSIAKSPGFADKCGQATAGAFAAFLGWQAASPAPAPAPTVADSPFIRAIRELLRQPAA